MKSKIKILFVRSLKSTFILKDVRFLQKKFDLKVLDFILNPLMPISTLGTIFNLLIAVLWADLTFSWFADNHAKWAVKISRIFKKKSIVLVGGYEVAKVPDLNYGLMLKPKTRKMVKYILDNADTIITVSEFTKNETLAVSSPKSIIVLYNSININKFVPKGNKHDIVLSVVLGSGSMERLKLKGINIFVEAALLLPDIEFILIGLTKEDIINLKYKYNDINNLRLLTVMPQEEIIEYYQRAKVYCQLSRRESFGVALAEAMSCCCVPVVSNSPALLEVIGDTGYYVSYGDVNGTVSAISDALKSNIDKQQKARQRIIKLFSDEIRERNLLNLIEMQFRKL